MQAWILADCVDHANAQYVQGPFWPSLKHPEGTQVLYGLHDYSGKSN